MNVMEELSDAGIQTASRVDYHTVAGSLDELAQALSAVPPGRVMIVAGDEVHSSGSTQEIVQLAEALSAHVYGSSWPLNLPFPTQHALWRGNMPTTAGEIASVINAYDAVFIIGGRSLIAILYSEGEAIPESCAVYQLSADMNELGRSYATRLSVMGDIKLSLHDLLPRLDQHRAASKLLHQQLLAQAREERENEWRQQEERLTAERLRPAISPMVAAWEVIRAIPAGTTIVDEAIATARHVRKFISDRQHQRYYFMRGGGLGWGMPAAVGHSLGLGREPVVCLVGDGASLYSPQALWTAAHEELPVTFIVMNNLEYNILKNFMKGQPGYSSTKLGRFIGMDLINPQIDFQSLGTALGIRCCRVTQAADIATAVTLGLKSGKTNLIEIAISAD
jgi:benzoylformate decarboxylase